ncbi:MAG TPA: ribulose-bisphosphate carboxylase large subunit, partial [Euryarchaeota archaeon]|nr:ribulose-bisphosphate carboxylase large subunit [Euryarchaeota archaeon]
MGEAYEGYIEVGKSIDYDEHIIVRFYVETTDNLIKALNAIAGESSIGTWTEVKTYKPEIQRLGAIVFRYKKLNNRSAMADIAYPLELFEEGNVPQLLSDVAGNIFGMKEVSNLRLLDIRFPKQYLQSFKGPSKGVEGIRKILGTEKTKRPHVGTIVKPKVGLSPKEFAKVAYEAWVGGIDFVKDDENLTNQKFCPFEDRVIYTLEAMDKAMEETGEKKMYAPNITGPYDIMVKRAEFVKDHGGNIVMIDVVTAGFSALQSFVKLNLDLPIHAHRAMHAAFTRNKKHGISMLALAKILRLVGVDQLHIGGIVGKMEGEASEIILIKKSIQEDLPETEEVLGQEWAHIKPVFAVASGGLHPGSVPAVIRYLGNDVVI